MPNSTFKKTLLFSVLLLGVFAVHAKETKKASTAGTHNYTSFTPRTIAPDPAWLEINREYAQHPDATFRLSDIPKPGAVEVLAKRTKDTRYFVDAAQPTRFWQDKSSGALNYQKNGQWYAIDAHLIPQGNNIFEATHQEEPVGFDLNQKVAYIRTVGGKVSFNKWELYGKANGVTTKLASANWSQYTIGDDGMYVTNIFPGIDAEMRVTRGAVKTNFVVHTNSFPGYSTLLFKDKFQDAGHGALAFADNASGNNRVGEVNFKTTGGNFLRIEKAIAYAARTSTGVTELKYALDQNSLSIVVDAAYINAQLANGGDLIIDPQVASQASLALASITGSMNCGAITNNCSYNLSVPVPPNATIVKVYNRFSVQALAPAVITNAFFGMLVNNGCGYFYNLTLASAGIVGTKDTGSTAIGFDSVTSIVRPCLPAPSCTPAPLIFTLRLWNTYCAAGPTGCSNVYVRANEDFVVRILGVTLEATSITRSSNTIICAGTPVTLSRAGNFGVPPYTFSWTPGGATTPAVTVSPTATTLYTSVVTDACGNSITDTTTVQVQNQTVPPVVVTPQTVCQFSAVPLTAIGPNLRWWTTPTGGVASSVAPTPPNVPGTYNYYVSSITLCGETPRAQITVTVIPKPAPPTVVSPQSVCQYAQLQLTAGGQNLRWYLTPTGGFGQPTLTPNTNYVDSFYYYVTQTVNGCESDRARIRFYVNYKPNGIVLPSRFFVCEGDTASFTYFGNALPDAGYNWSVVGGYNELISGQNTQGPVIVRFDSAGLRSVRVQVNNRGCLSEIATQTVTVRPNPKLTYTVKEYGCVGEVINVAFNSISPLIDSFKYGFPGAQIVYGAATGGPYGIRYSAPGTYAVTTMSYARECPSRLYSDNIVIHPLPDARFSMSRNEVCIGDTVQFVTASTEDSNMQYYWTPAHYFNSGNIYSGRGVIGADGYIKLRAVSKWGCQNTDSLYLKANVCCEMFFPNAFSPNSDGRNDIFKPVTLGHQEIKTFRILNRWGQVVFETKGDRMGWNGVYNGRDQDAGTYYYLIRYRCADSDKDLEQKGEVLLVR